MNLKQYLSQLDMESPEDFKYFEQFAELMEGEEDLPYDFFYTAISAVSSMDMGEILENYMDDLMNGLPDEGDELITVLDPMKQELLSLCENLEDAKQRTGFSDRLYSFRQWLRDSGNVIVDGTACSVLDAITEARAEKLLHGTINKKYDFSKAMDFQPEALSISLGSFEKINVAEETEK